VSFQCVLEVLKSVSGIVATGAIVTILTNYCVLEMTVCYLLLLSVSHCSHDSDEEVLLTAAAAGYCVITYLLGVGDRHLDNLLITKAGQNLDTAPWACPHSVN